MELMAVRMGMDTKNEEEREGIIYLSFGIGIRSLDGGALRTTIVPSLVLLVLQSYKANFVSPDIAQHSIAMTSCKFCLG